MWQGERGNSKIRNIFKIIIRWGCILLGITLEGIFSPKAGLIKPNSLNETSLKNVVSVGKEKWGDRTSSMPYHPKSPQKTPRAIPMPEFAEILPSYLWLNPSSRNLPPSWCSSAWSRHSDGYSWTGQIHQSLLRCPQENLLFPDKFRDFLALGQIKKFAFLLEGSKALHPCPPQKEVHETCSLKKTQ